MNQKKSQAYFTLFLMLIIFFSCQKNDPIIVDSPDGDSQIFDHDPTEIFKYIPPSAQRNGDPNAGYDYLIYGDYLTSGIPYDLYLSFAGNNPNLLNRTGDNAAV